MHRSNREGPGTVAKALKQEKMKCVTHLSCLKDHYDRNGDTENGIGLVEITFMGEVTAGRVIFGPDNVEPLLGVTALESVGITVDPTSRTLERLPAIPLK